MNKYIVRGLCALILTLGAFPAFGADNATVVVSGVLSEVLEIEKVIVNSVEYNPGNPGDFLANMTKESVTPVDATTNNMIFTPVKIRIKTNRKLPIAVNATFDELKHIATSTLIPASDLSVSPTSENISNPFNGVESNEFTFSTLIQTTTLTGAYEGTITFTVLPI